MKKIKFAVIGLGRIGQRHIEVIQKNEDAELSALIDVRPKNELSVRKLDIPFYNSLKDFFNASINIDIVSIATPNYCHYEHGMESLSHNVNVLIEKPLALTKQHAKTLIAKAAELNKEIFTVKQLRYSNVIQWLKKIIKQRLLGEIHIVQINCFWNRDEKYYTTDSWHGKKSTDGGTLFTQFSHFIDILYWIFGDIKNIQSKFSNLNHKNLIEFEDTGFVTFDFVREGIGNINYSTSVWEKNLESNIIVIAEKGTIKIGGQYLNKIEYCHVKDDTLIDKMPTFLQHDEVNNYHIQLIQSVISILQKKTGFANQPNEDLKVIDMIERIYNSN